MPGLLPLLARRNLLEDFGRHTPEAVWRRLPAAYVFLLPPGLPALHLSRLGQGPSLRMDGGVRPLPFVPVLARSSAAHFDGPARRQNRVPICTIRASDSCGRFCFGPPVLDGNSQ